MAKLRIEHSNQPSSDFDLASPCVTIGRGVENTLHFRDPWLSREHARFVADDGGYRLEDVGSRNGTFLNGQPVQSARQLRSGDVVTLGDVRLTYLDETASSLQLADSEISLTGRGTVLISSDELRYDQFARSRRDKEKPTDKVSDSLLPILNQAAAELINHYPLDELVERVLSQVLDAVPAERGALLLRSRRDGYAAEGDAVETGGVEESAPDPTSALEIVARRGYGANEEIRISRTLIRAVLEERQAVLTLDAQSDERFDRAVSIMMQGIRSILCAPLVNNDREVIGVIYLDHRVGGDVFSELALRLVGLMANLAAVKIENVYLLEDQIDKRRMEEQLAVGAQIQRRLLPAEDPVVEGYDVHGVNRSCFEIGGDYYDFILRSERKLAMVVADISGKGVGAALLMAVLQASLRTLIQTVEDPAELVERLNRVLVENSPDNKFATVFYAELDIEDHVLEYVSGGHNPALLLTGNGVEELGSSGPIVGLLPSAEFESQRVEMPEGATLLIYTDGVTELENLAQVEMGIEPLEEILNNHPGSSASGLTKTILRRMRAFAGSDQFDDDATMVVVQRAEVSGQGTAAMPVTPDSE